jgi:ribosomal protein S18 acetylase RimI-like enzyme
VDLTLRPESAEDVPLLRDLYASTRADEMAAAPWDDASKSAFLRMQFEAQRQHYRRAYSEAGFQIVLADGRWAGRLYVCRATDEIRVIDISLRPEYRRRGIGTTLLGALLAEANERGCRVTLLVDRRNPARRLYERLGFQSCGDDAVHVHMQSCGPELSGKLTIPIGDQA